MTIGARIYDNATATNFTTVSASTETLAQGEPASYVTVATESAFSSIVYSFAAAVTALFVITY